MTEFTQADLSRIYVVVPSDSGQGTVNLSAAQMSDRQFRDWITAKADMNGIQMIVPYGRLGFESRLNMVNRLVQNGVKIYTTPST